jgi:peptidoglycan/LPS O-acetylase OafA/YrhL
VNSGIIRGGASFLLGVIAFRIYNSTFKRPNYLFTSILELTAIIFLFIFANFKKDEVYLLDFIFIPLFFYLILVFSFNSGLVSLGIKFFKINYLGKLSYSIYLMHYPLMIIGHQFFSEYGTQIYIATLIGTAATTHFFIEKPFNTFFKSSQLRTGDYTNYFLLFLCATLLLLSISLVFLKFS